MPFPILVRQMTVQVNISGPLLEVGRQLVPRLASLARLRFAARYFTMSQAYTEAFNGPGACAE